MFVSVESKEPDQIMLVNYIKVYLDDKELRNCIEADSTAGTAKVLETRMGGLVIRNGETVSKILSGTVEFRLIEGAPIHVIEIYKRMKFS